MRASTTSSLHDLSVNTIGACAFRFLRRSWPGVMQLLRRMTCRRDRPWFALVFVPIAIIGAAVSMRLLLIVPLVALMFWWGSSETPWVWILGVLEAAWGIQWAVLGLTLLATYPRHRAAAAVCWIGYALLVAGIGAVNRWKYQRKYGM